MNAPQGGSRESKERLRNNAGVLFVTVYLQSIPLCTLCRPHDPISNGVVVVSNNVMGVVSIDTLGVKSLGRTSLIENRTKIEQKRRGFSRGQWFITEP